MKTTAKPTPGRWIIDIEDPHCEEDGGHVSIYSENSDPVCIIGDKNFSPHIEADAALIAEAGTVCHETGLSPREILTQRDELLKVLKEGRRAIGDHITPTDCYATGPRTGDHFRDLVQCPACSFIAMHDAAIAAIQNASKGGEKG